jgi:hypothetical protein
MKIKLERNYLKHDELENVPGFLVRIPYDAEVKWDQTVVASVAGLQVSDEETADAQTGTISLKIDVKATTGKLAAGTYSDVLTLTVAPQD